MELIGDLSLAELFTMSDKIGDKYLTDEEIRERNAKYDAVIDDLLDN
jgi:hypothetical protein